MEYFFIVRHYWNNLEKWEGNSSHTGQSYFNNYDDALRAFGSKCQELRKEDCHDGHDVISLLQVWFNEDNEEKCLSEFSMTAQHHRSSPVDSEVVLRRRRRRRESR